MASGEYLLNTWYAKRIIGDSAASSYNDALLQTGEGVTASMWIFNQNQHSSSATVLYGIKYIYEGTNADDTIDFYGGQNKNNEAISSAQVQLKTGSIWAGSEPIKNTNGSFQVNIGARSGAGKIYFSSAASAAGARGIYLTNANQDEASGIIFNQENEISSIAAFQTSPYLRVDAERNRAAAISEAKYRSIVFKDNTKTSGSYDNNTVGYIGVQLGTSQSNQTLLGTVNSYGVEKIFRIVAPYQASSTAVNCYITWTNGMVDNSIKPYQNDTYDLGSEDYGWNHIYIRGTTTNSHAIDGTNPYIEFSNAARNQYGRLVYTHLDTQGGQQSLAFIGNTDHTDTYIKSQNFMTNVAEKVGPLDGQTGVAILKEGAIHLTSASNTGEGGRIVFHYNGNTTANTGTGYIIGLNGLVKIGDRLAVNADSYQQKLGARTTTTSDFTFVVSGESFFSNTISANNGLEIHSHQNNKKGIELYNTDENSKQRVAALEISTPGAAGTTGYTRLVLGNLLTTTDDKNSTGYVRICRSNDDYCDYYSASWNGHETQESYTFLGATSTISGTNAYTYLYIGNSNSVNSTDKHSEGILRIYGSDTKYTNLRTAQTKTSNTMYLPNYNGNGYLVHTASSAAVGGETQPVYIATDGRATVIPADHDYHFYRGDRTWSDTLKGILTLYRESTTSDNSPAGIKFINKDTTVGREQNTGYIYAYNTHTDDNNGMNLVINSAGNVFIGGGEAPANVYTNTYKTSAGENLFCVADGSIYLESNATNTTGANRVGVIINSAGHVVPVKEETVNSNLQNLGQTNSRWQTLYLGTGIYIGEDNYTAYNSTYNGTRIAKRQMFLQNQDNEANGYYIYGEAQIYARLYLERIGTTSAYGQARLTLGNSVAAGTAKNATGRIFLYGQSDKYMLIEPYTLKSDITFSATADTFTMPKLNITSDKDSGGTSDLSGDSRPAFVIGPVTGEHLEMDYNEIMAKATKNTVGPLYINNDGGAISLLDTGTSYYVLIRSTADASSISNGALRVSGGASIAKKLYVGTQIVITNTSAASHIQFSRDTYNYLTIPATAGAQLCIGTAASTDSSLARFIYSTNGDAQQIRFNGYVSIFPKGGSHNQGMRIHNNGEWTLIMLCASDNTGDTGTSANSWLLGNHTGDLHFTKNGASGTGTVNFSNVDGYWRLRGDYAAATSGSVRSMLHIYGPTYGNDAAAIQSSTDGFMTIGDGGPQISFSGSADPASGQRGVLLFTDNDDCATGASFHFLSTESDWNVISKRFHARTSISIGTNLPNTTYNLYISGTTYGTGNITSHTSFKCDRTGYGLYLVDSSSAEYAGIYDNGSNLWIGATSSSGNHHHGALYLSAGYTGTTANTAIYLSIPKSGGHDSYPIVYKDAAGGANAPIYVNSSGKTVACTTYANATVGKANQLATARSLWGNSFNGTADVSGAISIKRSTVVIDTSSNNGNTGSSSLYQGISIIDSADYWYGQLYTAVDTNGRTRTYMNSRNKKTDGTEVSNSLAIGVNKDGTRYYSVTDAAAFRSAISAKGTQTAVSDPSASGTNITYIATISQNAQGVITATKSTVRSASSSQSGVVTTGAQTFAGNKTFSGSISYSYACSSYVNSLTASAVCFTNTSFGGWMCGKTKNGNIAIATYPGGNDLFYIGYGESGRTTNSYTRSLTWNGADGRLTATSVANAIWNDYAECRIADTLEPGRCITETISGKMTKTTSRLMPGCKLISDTYGTIMGETKDAQTPIAVAGRVLAYTYQDRNNYPLGAAVCSAPNGTIDIMTRDEIMMYPERIVGTVSEIPDYEIWHAGANGEKEILVDGRIWIYIK